VKMNDRAILDIKVRRAMRLLTGKWLTIRFLKNEAPRLVPYLSPTSRNGSLRWPSVTWTKAPGGLFFWSWMWTIMTVADQVVLVIEDNETNMKLARELLNSRGYTVLEAMDGMAGLEMAREHHPNLILIDIQLPGISGLEVISRLKEDINLQSIPAIAMTACAMMGDKETCLKNGFDAYISKPISVRKVLQTIEDLLSSSTSATLSCGNTVAG
jgi:two-component system, cell cycle response regulator DivK